jgi:2-polyprenyl-3-methyl-5-hydroxy-6-metoxy-1,4-benzoquinol methylase
MRYEPPKIEDRQIWDIWLSMFRLPAMSVAVELQVFESLATAPASAVDLGARLGLNQRGSSILLTLLAAMGLLRARKDKSSSPSVYEVSDLARTYLLRSSPHFWGPLLSSRLGTAGGQHMALLNALKAPEGGRSDASEAWKSGQMTPAMAEGITRVMHCHSLAAATGAAKHDGFAQVTRLLDVGGGSGCFSIAIAQQHPHVRCTVMDLAPVCNVARRYIEEGGVQDRVDAAPTDMFRETWPQGYDGVLFSNVFHDWNTATNRVLAKSAYDALSPGGRVFLHEMLLDDAHDGPLTTASFSMLMLVGTQGTQYTFAELREILESVGFADIRADTTHSYYAVVSGRKP